MSTKLILASASDSRRRMLKAAGIPFEAAAPDIDEETLKRTLAGRPPAKIATALAEKKALSIPSRNADALVLGADQLLVCEGAIYSKARDQAEAKRVLRELRGRKHRLVTAAVLAKAGTIIWRQVETASLWMRDFSDVFLDAYLASQGDAALSVVGCYRIEGEGAQLFARIEGDTFSIQGLPLFAVMEELRRQGVLG